MTIMVDKLETLVSELYKYLSESEQETTDILINKRVTSFNEFTKLSIETRQTLLNIREMRQKIDEVLEAMNNDNM